MRSGVTTSTPDDTSPAQRPSAERAGPSASRLGAVPTAVSPTRYVTVATGSYLARVIENAVSIGIAVPHENAFEEVRVAADEIRGERHEGDMAAVTRNGGALAVVVAHLIRRGHTGLRSG